MKKLIVILVLIFWGFVGVSELTANPRVSGYFYTGLSPYGSWIEIDYGVVVWRPTIMRMDWSPYRDGRWIWTSDGWYWQSYEPFGYITYHYGRWYFDDYYGWLWYPDYEWAPAWVEWRYDDYYIGWAPLHPYAMFYISIGIQYTTTYYTPYYHWNFVAYNHFYDPYVYNHCLGPRYKYRVYSNTRYRTNYSYHNGRVRNYGVDIQVVRSRSGNKIRQRDLLSVSDPLSLDSRNISKDNKIRTFYKSRDELVRNEVRDVKVTRSDRKSSLDVTRLNKSDLKKKNVLTSNERKRNNQVKINENQKDNFTKKERKKTNDDRRIKTSNDRKKSGNDIGRKKNKNDNVNRTFKKNVEKRNDKKINIKRSNSNINRNIRIQKKATKTKKFDRKETNDNKRKVTTQTNTKKETRVNKNSSNNRNKKNVTTKRNENKNNRTTVKKNSGNKNKQNKRSKR